MDIKDFLCEQLKSGELIYNKIATQLTEQQFKQHLPNDGASPMWVFGHVAVNEDFFLSLLAGTQRQFSQAFIDLFQPDDGYHHDEINTNYTKEIVVDLFRQQRKRVYEQLQLADVSTFDGHAPEGLPKVFSSLGAAWGILGTHQYWHVGHLTAVRHMFKEAMFEF